MRHWKLKTSGVFGPFLDIFKNTILKLQVLLSKESMDEVRRMCKAWQSWIEHDRTNEKCGKTLRCEFFRQVLAPFFAHYDANGGELGDVS